MRIANRLNNHPVLVLPIALVALFLPVLIIEYQVARHVGSTFMYPLDDAFIHLVISKNLALNGTWGITGGEFQSGSSSLLYTLVLATFIRIFSDHSSLPFVVNSITAIFLVAAIWKRLQKENIKPAAQLIILFSAILLTPIPILIVSGMEDIMQCLFTFLFIFRFSTWMEQTEEAGNKERLPLSLLVCGILCCSVRYEGMFLISISSFLLFRRNKVQGVVLASVSMLPIIIFGIFSLWKGSYFLPNPVLLKSESPQLTMGGISHFLYNIFQNQLAIMHAGISSIAVRCMLIAFLLSFLYLRRLIPKTSHYRYALILLIACTLMQMTLNTSGWFYRYEAYLVLNGVVLLLILFFKYPQPIISKFRRQPALIGLIFLIVSIPVFMRGAIVFLKSPKACVNIYDQSYQMAKFLQAYYDNEVAAVLDIGATSYFKKQKNIDLRGLTNYKVAVSVKKKYYTPAFLDSLCKSEKVSIAILDQSFFGDSLLGRWNKVADWTIPNNVVCEDSTVSFYAIEKSMTADLKRNLLQYQPNLPPGVKVRYY